VEVILEKRENHFHFFKCRVSQKFDLKSVTL